MSVLLALVSGFTSYFERKFDQRKLGKLSWGAMEET